MEQMTTDIAVIGAGVIGTTIAERLQHEGKKVLLIDRDGPGSGCSKGNAGHFATDVILPLANFDNLLAVPKLLMDPLGPLTIKWSYLPKLMPWLLRYAWAAMPHNAQQSIEALKLLNRPSISRFSALLSRTGLTELMVKNGALTVYCSAGAAVKNRRHAEFVRRHGVNVEQLDKHQIHQLEPALSDHIIGGLYYPDTAHTIDPYRLVTALAAQFSQAGGDYLEDEVLGFDFSQSDRVLVKTKGRNISAGQVVIAAGAWSKSLVAMVGHKVPLETERGYHMMLPAPGISLNRPVVSFERSFVMTPMEQGLRLAGTVELAGLASPANEQRAQILFNHAREVLPAVQKAGQIETWMGHRPSLPDSLPVIGRSPLQPRILLAFGHQHLGLTQAAVTADLISEVVHNLPHQVDIRPFSVTRF